MKKILTCLLAILGLSTACGQQTFEVDEFKTKVLFPYHYGQTNVSGIASQLKGTGIDVRIRHYE